MIMKDLLLLRSFLKKHFFVIESLPTKMRNSKIKSCIFILKTGELGLQRQVTVVKGLHNWYQFHLEQLAGRLVYSPPPKNVVDNTKKVTTESIPGVKVQEWRIIEISFLNWFCHCLIFDVFFQSQKMMREYKLQLLWNWKLTLMLDKLNTACFQKRIYLV